MFCLVVLHQLITSYAMPIDGKHVFDLLCTSYFLTAYDSVPKFGVGTYSTGHLLPQTPNPFPITDSFRYSGDIASRVSICIEDQRTMMSDFCQFAIVKSTDATVSCLPLLNLRRGRNGVTRL